MSSSGSNEQRPPPRIAAPLRVLHVIDGVAGGGAEQLLWDQIRLGPADIQQQLVTVFPEHGDSGYAERLGAYRGGGQPRASRLLGLLRDRATSRPRGSARRRLYSSAYYAGSLAWSGFWLLRAVLAFRPAVLHAHLFFALPLALAVRALWAGRIRLVTSVPCLVAQMADVDGEWLAALYARFHPRVDRFFTGASPRELVSLGVPAEKIFWISAAVDVASIERARGQRAAHRQQVCARLGLGIEQCIVLSVGRLHPSKGHLFALDALPELLARHPGLAWVVLGVGPQRAELVARAAELGVSGHVHFVGFQEDPLPYYGAADVYLRTPVFEAENLASYIALAMGLPVVGFDTGGETELLRKVGHGILVPNRDSRALASAVTDLLERPDRGQSQGALGAAYAQRLDLSTTIAAIAEVYRELGGERGV